MEIVLQKVAKLSESTLAFRFVPAGGGHLKFKPGQFYRFKFTDKRGEFERSYSLCKIVDSIIIIFILIGRFGASVIVVAVVIVCTIVIVIILIGKIGACVVVLISIVVIVIVIKAMFSFGGIIIYGVYDGI